MSRRWRRTIGRLDASPSVRPPFGQSVPTIGFVGTADPAIWSVRDMRAVMPQFVLRTIEGAAHGGDQGILRRGEFVTQLLEFLRERDRLRP